MQTIRLARTGQPPLEVEVGERIVDITTQRRAPDTTRWHDIACWEVDDGRVAISVEWHTRREGEQGHNTTTVVEREGAITWLRSLDPLAYYVGPPAQTGGGRREREMRDITERWQHAISQVAARLHSLLGAKRKD